MDKNALSAYRKLREEIRSGKLHNIYCLSGVESYYGDKLAELLLSTVVDPSMKDFNEIVLYGPDVDGSQVVEACKQFPMMSDKILIVLREANRMKNWDALMTYVKKPQPSTVLAIVHPGKLDGRKEVTKILKKHSDVFFETMETYDNKLPEFVEFRLKEMNRRATPESIRILCEFIGSDLHRIDNELKKLESNIGPDEEITPDIIEEFVGISKIYNNFEFSRAVLMRDVPKAMNIAKVFEANPKLAPLLVITSLLYSSFSKLLLLHATKINDQNEAARALGMSPYFVHEYITAKKRYTYAETLRIISLLRKFDGYSKGVGGNVHPPLLSQLICEIAL